MIRYLKNWFEQQFSDPQRVILVLLLVAAVAVVLMMGRLLAPVLVALVIAYLLDGLVSLLVRYRVPHLLSVILVFTLFILTFLFLIATLVPKAISQTRELAGQSEVWQEQIRQGISNLAERYPEFIDEGPFFELLQDLGFRRVGEEPEESEEEQEAEEVARETAPESSGPAFLPFGQTFNIAVQRALGGVGVASTIQYTLVMLVYLILIPLMVFFFLKDKQSILSWLARFLPENRQLANQVWQESNRQIANYIRGKFWEILIVGTVSSIAFSLLGLDYALLLGAATGLSVIIPYVGATLVTIPIALVGYFQFGWSGEFLTVMVVYFVIQALDANLLVPILFSRVVNLHPVAIIIAILFFGSIWGIWGVFFAIPLATIVKATIVAWQTVEKQNPEEEPATG